MKIRYGCHNKVRHPQDCDGQRGYSAEKLDGLVEKMVLHLFSNVKSLPEAKLMAGQAERKTAEAVSTLANLKALHAAKNKELESYKSEVYKAIQGTSNWSGELLNELITETKSAIESSKKKWLKLRRSWMTVKGCCLNYLENFLYISVDCHEILCYYFLNILII